MILLNACEIVNICITIIASIILVFILLFSFNVNGKNRANKWMEKELIQLNSFDISKYFKESEQKSATDRIIRQYLLVKTKAKQHFDIMTHFSVRYYTVINLTAICSIITAIVAFFVLDRGIRDVHYLVLTLFIVFSSFTTYFAAFPKFFEHKKNILTNKMISIEYKYLLNKIETYISLEEPNIVLDAFIIEIDNAIKKIDDYPLFMEINTNFNPKSIFEGIKIS